MQPPSTTARRNVRPAKGLSCRMLRAVLVLSLWHAPIPWVHAHEIEGAHVDHRQLLSRHVAEFHAHELSRGEHELDWHVHLILPWSLSHHLPCPDRDERQPGSDDYFAATGFSAVGTDVAQTIGAPCRGFESPEWSAGQTGLPAEVAARTAIIAGAQGSRVFETHGRTDAVRDLMGVRLC